MSSLGEVLGNTEKVKTENGTFFITRHDRVEQLEAENAKLRELTRDYLIFNSQPGCTYCFCYNECHESDEPPCMAFEKLVDRTNELGIKVDDAG